MPDPENQNTLEDQLSKVEQAINTSIAAVSVKPAPAKVAPLKAVPTKQLPKPPVKAVAKPAAKAPVKVTTSPPAKPATQVVDAGGLINQDAVNQMQQDAAGIPPAAETLKGISDMETSSDTSTVVDAPVKNVFEFNKFNRVFVNAMFTLNLGDDRMFDSKAALSSVKINGDTLNLYSPFRKAAKKKTDTAVETPSEGVLRHSLEALLDITDEVNNSKIVFVGKSPDARAMLVGAIESTRNSIENLFPVSPDHVLFDICTDEEGNPEDDPETAAEDEDEDDEDIKVDASGSKDEICFKDVISVRSWINSPESSYSAEDVHNAVVNFVINAGAFYDTDERAKYLHQVETVLNLITSSRPDSSTNVLLAVNMSSAQLNDPSIRELLNQLLSEEDYILYARSELCKADVSDWLPQSVKDIDESLLSSNCDLLLVKLLGEQPEATVEAA